MPKHKMPSAQPSLFKKAVPQMPEGYYSSGPNPNLRRFIEEHSKPYNIATDIYNVPPFDQPITTTKTTDIYNLHRYWSKKPHDAIREYIKHYTQPNDLVLDPFCGSGGTALATIMEGRTAIAIDLSPAATFITKNYCTLVDIDNLKRSFEELQRKVRPEIEWLYETRCDRCDGKATTAYTVYSYVFQCPRCLEKVALFDCPENQSHTAAGKPKTIRVCPHCQERGHQEEIKTSGMRFEPVPVLVNYLCEEGCRPKRAERRHNDADEKKRTYFKQYDLEKLIEIEAKPLPYWYPPHRMMNIESNTEPWGDKWRAGTSNFRTVAALYTKRNLWALSCMMNAAREMKNDSIIFATVSLSLGLSRMCQYDPKWSFPYPLASGTYYVPQISKEMNVLLGVSSKFQGTLISGLSSILESAKREDLNTWPIFVSTQSATNMSNIPNDCVDFIFTDPPYGNNIQYGELNFVWESWLNFDTNWLDQEIIVNRTRGKTDRDWAYMIKQALKECFRVLKPGRWLALCYHDTSEGTWQLLQDVMTEIGFISETSENVLFIDTETKSFNQYTADKVTKRDLVINFRKPRPGELAEAVTISGDEDAKTFTEKARLILEESLESHPGATADRLYDDLVSRMVRRGEFERHNFDELLRSVAEDVDGHFYLLNTADKVDEAESKKETSAAKRLESYMGRVLVEQRDAMGIHYSDLFEQYLPIKDKPRRLLQDWLPEFFYKTTEGTWRPPANKEERQQKAALRSSGALRRIKRFANALIDGVPPADRDKPENAITLADWIRQCRRAGLFELGRVLYEKGGLRFDELNEEMRLLVEEDYQICVGRSEKQVTKRKAKGQQLSLMEE